MIQFLMNHPSMFLFLLPAVPSILGRVEKAIIASLLSKGDAVDQELLASVAKAIVLWAEKKGIQNGATKFSLADKLVARAMPFLSEDQRKTLIENAVSEMDKAAHAAMNAATVPPPAK